MGKRPNVTEQTKRNLIDAFWSIYCDTRIENITVKDVAHKAGYNRGTFYEYFTDVYDVLEQIEESLVPSIEELPPLAMADYSLGMPIELFMKLFEKNSQYYAVLLGDNGDPAFASKLKHRIKPLLMKVIADNRKPNSLKLDFVMEYVLSAMIGILSYWFRMGKELPAEELIALISDLMENGIIRHLEDQHKEAGQ